MLASECGVEKSKEDRLPLLRSNLPGPSCWYAWRRLVDPDKDAELAAEAWGAAGFGAMAIGAVRETAGEWDMLILSTIGRGRIAIRSMIGTMQESVTRG